MKDRKKPVVIEAYQTDKELNIETLEGTMHASAGDYIITGVNGEQYPCKPDIFKKTYDEISDEIYDEDLVRRQSVLNILLYHNATQHLKMIKNLPKKEFLTSFSQFKIGKRAHPSSIFTFSG